MTQYCNLTIDFRDEKVKYRCPNDETDDEAHGKDHYKFTFNLNDMDNDEYAAPLTLAPTEELLIEGYEVKGDGGYHWEI